MISNSNLTSYNIVSRHKSTITLAANSVKRYSDVGQIFDDVDFTKYGLSNIMVVPSDTSNAIGYVCEVSGTLYVYLRNLSNSQITIDFETRGTFARTF